MSRSGNFALIESLDLISRKIWVIEKSWHFHTVFTKKELFPRTFCCENNFEKMTNHLFFAFFRCDYPVSTSWYYWIPYLIFRTWYFNFAYLSNCSVRPNPNGSAEPSVNFGRTGSAELFGQIAELPNLKITPFWRKKLQFSVKFESF